MSYAGEWDHLETPATRRLRWGVSFALVTSLFSAASWLILQRVPPAAPPAIPSQAVMIDLTPAPPAVPAPPPPQELQPPAPPESPPLPPAPPAPAPEVAAPPPRPKPVPRHPHTPPPPPVAAPQTPVASAPPAPAVPPAASAPPSNAVPNWQSALLAQLEKYKRYPASAQINGETGVAYLHFSMDRNGNILSAAIVKSSGHSALDNEALALIHRADPLPKPPPDIPGEIIERTVPIQFALDQSD